MTKGVEKPWVLQDYVDWYSHRFMRLLPIPLVCAAGVLGAQLYARVAARQNPPWWNQMLETIARMTGEVDASRIETLRRRYIEHNAGLRAEYSCNERLMQSSRLQVTGLEHLAARKGPTVFIYAHLGNFELVGHGLTRQGIPFVGLYDPPPMPSHVRIVEGTRARFLSVVPDSYMVPSTSHAARDLMRAVKRGHNLVIAVDEMTKDVVWAPSFGRRLPYYGNRLLAARLALLGGGDVIPIRTRRTGFGTYAVAFQPPIKWEAGGDTQQDSRTLADAISATIEPWIIADIDQWHWLPYLDLDRPLADFAPIRRHSL